MKRMWKQGYVRVGLVAGVLIGMAVLASLCLPPFLKRAEAACNPPPSGPSYELAITNVVVDPTNKAVCINCPIEFKADAQSIPPNVDGHSHPANWTLGAKPPTTTPGVYTNTAWDYHQYDAGPYPNNCTAHVDVVFSVVKVTFGDLDHVCKKGLAPDAHANHNVSVTVTPSAPVTLEIDCTEGTGGAVFDGGGTSKAISSSQYVTIRGVTGSSKLNNMRLQAKVGTCYCPDKKPFTVFDPDTFTAKEKVHGNNLASVTTEALTNLFVCQQDDAGDTHLDPLTLTWSPANEDKSRFKWNIDGSWHDQNAGDFSATAAILSKWTEETERTRLLNAWYDCNGNGTFQTNEPFRNINVKVVDLKKLTLSSTNCAHTVVVTGTARDSSSSPPARDTTTEIDLIQKTPDSTPVPMALTLDWMPTDAPTNRMRWKICANGTQTPSSLWAPSSGTFEGTQPIRTKWAMAGTDPAVVQREFDVRAWYDCSDNTAFEWNEPRRLLYAEVPFFDYIQVKNEDGKETLACKAPSIQIKRKYPATRTIQWKNESNTAEGDSYTAALENKPGELSMVELWAYDKRHPDSPTCVKELARIYNGCSCVFCTRFGGEMERELSGTGAKVVLSLGSAALWIDLSVTLDKSFRINNLRWPRERWVNGKQVSYSWIDPMIITVDDDGVVRRFENEFGVAIVEDIPGGGLRLTLTSANGGTTVVYEFTDPDAHPHPEDATRVKFVEKHNGVEYSSDLLSTAQDGDATIWTWTRGNGERVETLHSAPDGIYVNRLRTVKDQNEQVATKTLEKTRDFGWGEVTVERVADPDGAALTTRMVYYTNSVETGRYSQLQSELGADGSWARYDYASSGLPTLVARGLLDAPTNAPNSAVQVTSYDYAAHVSEPPAVFPREPRTVIETIAGVTNSILFRTFTNNAQGELVGVEERASAASAAFGDSGNLRTITIRHSTVSSNSAEAGRIKSIQRPDGRLDSYVYENGFYATNGTLGAYTFVVNPTGGYTRVAVTHGTVDSPAGLALRTTRDVTVQDKFDRTLFTESRVYTGSEYERVEWTQYQLDADGHVAATWRSDGSLSESIWGCCGKEWEKDGNGIEQSYSYDQLHRLDVSTKQAASPIYRIARFDADGRVLTVTNSAGGLVLVSRNTYDLAGRTVQSVDAAGLITTYSYSSDGLTNTVVSPSGLTNMTVNYPDGRTRSTLENGVAKTTYDYGVNADGTQWTISYAGPSGLNSPMWSKTTVDMLGRTIVEERSGFGGSVLTTEFFYNAKGQLVKTTTTGSAATLYEYDDLGEQIRSGLDVDGDDTIDLSGPDRVNESSTSYQSYSSQWWRVSASAVYAADGSATATTTSVQRVQLTGLGGSVAGGSLASATVSLDIQGNQTVSQTAIDRATKTVTQVTQYPDSTNAAVSVSVNGVTTSSTSKSGITTTYASDALERPISVTDPRTGTSTTHYNDLGQVDYVEDAATNRTSFAYDPDSGRQIAVSNALGYVVNSHFDARGQLLATWGATYPVAYDFDAYGRMAAMYTLRTNLTLASFADFCSNLSFFDKTTWLYDEATGLLTNKLYADTNGVYYTYTPEGRLQTRTWARGIVTTYSYTNTTGEMVGIGYGDSNATPDVSFTFNRLGQQVTVSDGQGTRTFTYNDALQLAAETNVMGVITRQSRSRRMRADNPNTVASRRLIELLRLKTAFSASTFVTAYRFDDEDGIIFRK